MPPTARLYLLSIVFVLLEQTCFAQPSNDDCANAILLPTATTCFNSKGRVDAATTSAGVPIGSCTGNPNDDVWYKFVATSTNPTITLSNLTGGLTGTTARLQLLSGTCVSLTSLACGTTSITASGLTIGTMYYIRVYSSGAGAVTNGIFNICITDPGVAPVSDSTTALFNTDIVATKLGYPWEITYGPDDSLWITEARGYRVLRVSASRTQTQNNISPQQVLKIPLGSSQVSFDRSIGTWPQGGMEGLAIHPEFMTNSSKRWVYLAYVYKGTCPSNPSSPCIFRSKIVRCQFYFAADAGNPSSLPKKDTLIILDTLISNLPGSNDHNSGRLKISPVTEGPDNTYKLYYTIGDMGAGQFNNATRTNNAQNKDTTEGKILRLNTEPDGDGIPGSPIHDYDKWRQWIPNDNPFAHSVFTSLRTPIYSYGHRNAQGLVWGNVNGTWRLYSSEHGDRSDDEVNLIQSGKNYGWPKVTGLNDDNYTTSDNTSNGFTLNDVLANQTVADETTFASSTPNYTNPIFTFFSWTPAQIETINTGNIFTWPTIAPSSIDFYNSIQLPGWSNSLLVPSLKYGMYRLKLNAAGTAIDSTVCTNLIDTLPLLHSWRVRDIAISPDGTTIWAVTDSSGSTSGPTGGFNGGSISTKDPGIILRLKVKNIIVLPVQFLSFTGKLLPDKSVQLDWETSTDALHDYFEIQRSNGNNSFIALGRINSTPPYQYFDYSPAGGNNYYRIKQVDRNGRATYSKTITIFIKEDFAVTMFPNPVKQALHLKFSSSDVNPVLIQISDLAGRIIYSGKQSPNAGVSIDVNKWNPQVYILKVVNSKSQVITTQKFEKL